MKGRVWVPETQFGDAGVGADSLLQQPAKLLDRLWLGVMLREVVVV
jgi:hypothetical protein